MSTSKTITISMSPLLLLATIVLAILKLGEIGAFATISWWLVFLPILVPFAIWLCLVVLAIFGMFIALIISKMFGRKTRRFK